MQSALLATFKLALDIFLPPRKSSLLVRATQLSDLENVSLSNGSLPYHDERIKALVWEIKYRRNSHALSLAGEYMSHVLFEKAAEEIGRPLLIPIPMHAKRRRERGYNPTELICEEVLRRKESTSAFEYAPKALLKIRHSPTQQSLVRRNRLRNTEFSMEGDAVQVKGRVCFVLDDVRTTGATCKEAARALEKAGARKTLCIALADSTS